MSTGKKSTPPEPGRYRFVRESEPETVRFPPVATGAQIGRVASTPVEDDVDEPSKLIRRVTTTIPIRSSHDDRALGRRARGVIADLAYAAPGAEDAFVESVRALGAAGLEAIGREFPGNVWFDRHAPFAREPLGRFVSPLASMLFRLGEESVPEITRLLGDVREDIRYYAALLALDLDHPAFARPMASLLLDDDSDLVRLALTFCTRTDERAGSLVRALEREAEDASRRDPIRSDALTQMIAMIEPR